MSTIVGTNIEVTNLKFDSDTTSMIISNTGQVTVQGEGTNTTNLQQGLAKAFLAYKGNTVNAIYDSNNISSVSDVATGKQTPNFTNNFNGANDYAAVAFAQQDTGGGGRNVAGIGSPATSNRPYNSVNLSNTLTDMEWINFSFHGDLA